MGSPPERTGVHDPVLRGKCIARILAQRRRPFGVAAQSQQRFELLKKLPDHLFLNRILTVGERF